MKHCWLLLFAFGMPATAGAAPLPVRPAYCLVTSTHISVCNYYSKALCTRDAGMQAATCEAAPSTVDERRRVPAG